MKVKHELEPIYDENSKILILGSIPSVKSRELKFYYAHKTNRFWQILESLYQTKLITNEDKKNFLIQNNIALWDVIKECDIEASADSKIKKVKCNNLNSIINKSQIKQIYVTGKVALKYYNEYLLKETKIKAIYLPSPSAANASLKLNDLIKAYQVIKNSN